MRLLGKSVLTLGVAFWLGVAAGATADTPVVCTEGDQALFRFDVPDFWMLHTGGPRELQDTQLGDARTVGRVMAARPVTDDSVWIGFVSPFGVATIEEGVRYLADIEKFLVKDPQVTGAGDPGDRAARRARIECHGRDD